MTMDENTRAKYEEKIKTLLRHGQKEKECAGIPGDQRLHFADLHLEEEQMDEDSGCIWKQNNIDVLRITDDDDVPGRRTASGRMKTMWMWKIWI